MTRKRNRNSASCSRSWRVSAAKRAARAVAVRKLYVEMLNRDPTGADEAGVDYWTDSKLTLEQVRQELVVQAAEERRLQVRAIYVDVLGRERFPDLGLPQPTPESAQGDLMLAAADGVFFTGHPTEEAAAAAPVYVAAHGHAPTIPQLAAAFMMAGAGVRPGVSVDRVSMLDLAPTAAVLLGVDLPLAEGRPLAEGLLGPSLR